MKGDNSRSKTDIDKGFRYSESVKIFHCSGMNFVAIKSSFDSPVVYFKGGPIPKEIIIFIRKSTIRGAI